MQTNVMAPRNKRRLTCGSFDVPDLPKIMSSLVLDAGSPVMSDTASPNSSSHTLDTMPSPVFEAEANEEEESDSIVAASPFSTSSSSTSTATGSGRTRLSRASKADCLLRMNRRVSMKPQRKVVSAKNSTEASEEDIKKFYLNNKLTSATSRQNALETIFEEPSVVRNELRMIGLKKLKRQINFKDGVTISKTTVQSRRKKIKSLFGASANKFKKISMDAFLKHLQTISDPAEEEDEQQQQPQQGAYRSQPLATTSSSSGQSSAI